MAIAPKFMPRQANLESSGTAYSAVWIGTAILMAVVLGVVAMTMVKAATGEVSISDLAPRLILGAMGVLFVVVGNYLPKTRSNWILGVRTPWTLSSETSWMKTHRLTGRLFAIGGVSVILVAAIAPMIWTVPIVLAVAIGIPIFGILYSWLVWRSADDRTDDPDYLI